MNKAIICLQKKYNLNISTFPFLLYFPTTEVTELKNDQLKKKNFLASPLFF